MTRRTTASSNVPARAAHAWLLGISLGLALSLSASAQTPGDSDDLARQAQSSSTLIGEGAGVGSGAHTTPDQIPATTRLQQPEFGRQRLIGQPEPREIEARPKYQPNEFERFVQSQSTVPVGRFGIELLTDPTLISAAPDPLPLVPADYVVRPGDEIAVNIWGTVDADLRLIVDRAGRITLPRVGSINVGGIRYGELSDTVQRHVAQVFKNFQLTVTLGQIRPIRVFITGYAQRRGSITVNGLSSVLHALMRAGGPSEAGSFRDIHLIRGGNEIAVFDLYDLLLRGKRSSDQIMQPDDILFIGPIGPEVGVLGSVNQSAVYELKPGETLGDVLHMAGGMDGVADRTRVSIERLSDRDSGRVVELSMPAHAKDVLSGGDLVRVFSVVESSLPKLKQNEHVRVEGEVARPGDYILPPGSRMSDALRAAGGATEAAYFFGTDFRRESVRKTQQQNYDRALRDLETDMAKAAASQRAMTAEDLNAQSASATANARLLDRLRQVRPTGRVILELDPDANSLPNVALEDGDTISIPSRGSSVGIFGSVFNAGNYLYTDGHTTEQYMRLAGGPTRGADKGSIFMIRANGSVISSRQDAGFWHSGSAFWNSPVEPGDTIFVPEEINKTTFVQDAKDWTQILYQFGLGVAGIKSLGL